MNELRRQTWSGFRVNASKLTSGIVIVVYVDRVILYNHKMPLSRTNLNLTALCREGQLKEALHILLTTHNPPEDCSTYLQLLQTCVLKKSLSQGKNVHSFIAHRRFAFAPSTTFHNRLIFMYSNCGSLVDCRKVFDHMKERDVSSWNTIITAYRRHGYPNEAVTLFHKMQQTGFQPDKFTFANVLPACAKMGALEKGYAQIGLFEKALAIFKQMRLACVKPNSTTFISTLPACAKMGALQQGMEIHRSSLEEGTSSDVRFSIGMETSDMNTGLGVFTATLLSALDPINVATYVLLSNIYAELGRCMHSTLGAACLPGLLSIMGDVELTENYHLWLSGRTRHCWMGAVSSIFSAIADIEIGIDLEDAFEAYRETRDVLKFVDHPYKMVVNPLNIFFYGLLEASDVLVKRAKHFVFLFRKKCDDNGGLRSLQSSCIFYRMISAMDGKSEGFAQFSTRENAQLQRQVQGHQNGNLTERSR
ncbi:pentatricopeptide repeat-containing protein At3g53360, mitochondrial [Cryptomeria japonica]|uniref:pentatricopeptide repeat-containing protein At3g53360, mitochondrial n=1 Tax=Cryptomeria japonica TaxID=3369 RepID=UPI0027DA316E|nr:pentatricopeptide repeat-containing protein At3g53360, mitochondrial [Cryptomeria japonica]